MTDVGRIAAAIIARFPQCILERHLERFEWRGDSWESAWLKREELSKQLCLALESAEQESLLAALRAIHSWGFAKASVFPAAIERRVDEAGAVLIEIRSELSLNKVNGLLNVPGVGIATASKWICLLDQSAFAIYDSRVSVALREICVDEKRCFPILPPWKGSNSWPQDYVTKERMATYYLRYIEALREVSESYTAMSPARIEMALFMAGKEPCPSQSAWKADRKPLAR
ncbi:hypothetical protein [Arenimonas caeni]|uniref:hypothetical protein n=1 Tax=Arenimonas caeni TaxID=2058085 RepID=UPI0013B06113|nr:hypothetical protein [Arenimonas caeni]